MALFPRCNNPVPVVGRHGLTLVGCHSCIQCRVAAQERLCKILEVEASKHKYVEFITLTYDDLHLPYIDTSYMYPFGYALRVPNRVIKKYNRRTKSFYFVEDKISKSFQLSDFSTIDTAPLLRDYYSRIDKYYSRFPSRSRGIRNNSVIPILWYDDIRKYIGRLRKWFLKEYDETIRYYVICEYGSQSFRPHYHLLLFHDSPRARADFRIVRTLPQSTKENPREICVKLDLAGLWVYGDTTTKVTDGNMQEYVSKYLTQHSNFPRVLDKFPQRSFHSILLGSKDRNEVRELLKARDFETLTTDYVINKKGVRRPVSMSDAYYSQFAVKFTGSSCFDVAATSTLFRSVVHVARRFFSSGGEIFDDGQVREFLLWLFNPSTTELYKYDYQFRAVHWYAVYHFLRHDDNHFAGHLHSCHVQQAARQSSGQGLYGICPVNAYQTFHSCFYANRFHGFVTGADVCHSDNSTYYCKRNQSAFAGNACLCAADRRTYRYYDFAGKYVCTDGVHCSCWCVLYVLRYL